MVSSQRFFSALVRWLPFAAVLTLGLGLTYLAGQQVYRQGANDPQLQIAEDAASAILAGRDPAAVVPNENVDLQSSLGSVVMVLDGEGKLIAGNAELDGKKVSPPIGVITHARETGRNIVTWQPQPGVRQALVVVARQADHRRLSVAVGRSLREVESRIGDLGTLMLVGWTAGLSLSLGLVFLTAERSLV